LDVGHLDLYSFKNGLFCGRHGLTMNFGQSAFKSLDHYAFLSAHPHESSSDSIHLNSATIFRGFCLLSLNQIEQNSSLKACDKGWADMRIRCKQLVKKTRMDGSNSSFIISYFSWDRSQIGDFRVLLQGVSILRLYLYTGGNDSG